MVHVLSIDDTIQSVVCETLEQGGHAGMKAHQGLGIFHELQREFPQATIVTVSLSALLAALDEAVESQDV